MIEFIKQLCPWCKWEVRFDKTDTYVECPYCLGQSKNNGGLLVRT